jgi:hypothetical protein
LQAKLSALGDQEKKKRGRNANSYTGNFGGKQKPKVAIV